MGMISAGIFGDTFIRPVRGPKVVKIIPRPIAVLFSHGLTNKLQLHKEHWFSNKTMRLDTLPSKPWPSKRIRGKSGHEPPNLADLNPKKPYCLSSSERFTRMDTSLDQWTPSGRPFRRMQRLSHPLGSRLIDVVRKKGWHIIK